MKTLSQKTVDKIKLNGTPIGLVDTPRGRLHIWQVIKSCGYKTNYLPKAFQYVELPSGAMARLTKQIKSYWENQGWHMKKF